MISAITNSTIKTSNRKAGNEKFSCKKMPDIFTKEIHLDSKYFRTHESAT